MRPTLAIALIPCCLLALAALRPAHASDFNGDGYPDFAVGCRGEVVAGHPEAGAVHVLFGGPDCFATVSAQVLSEASFPTLAAPGDYELFGEALASGDFDGDGYGDLAIGASNEEVSGLQAAGAVYVVYGSPAGLDVSRAAEFNQDTPGIPDKAEPGDFQFPDLSAETFGRTLAAGDFDADGYDDLALYVGETFGSKAKAKSFAGAVHVLRGSPTGLVVKGNRMFRQGKAGVPGKPAADAKFGWALVAADFNQDGVDDLAIGAPGELSEGSVTILFGKAKKGLVGKHAVRIDETDAGGTPDLATAHHFGESLAVGDFDGSGAPQLVIGAPLQDVGATAYAGGVYVLELAPDLSIASATFLSRATPGIDGGLWDVGEFGFSLAVGDFDGDGYDDLAIGCPGDGVGGADNAGSVSVLAGSSGGLFASALLLDQDVGGVPDSAELNDAFGAALAAADYDGDGDSDLALGVPGETLGNVSTAGGVLVLEGGGAALLDLAQAHWLDKTVSGVGGAPGSNDNLGGALSP